MSDSLNEQLKEADNASGQQTNTTTPRWLPRAHPLSWAMLVITTLAILMNSIDRIILPTLLPAIMKDFNLSEVQAGWINSLSFFGTLSGAVLFGLLSDYIGSGYRRCYSWCLAVLVEIISGVATAFCKSLGAFQALRVFMGMGTGGSEPINVALLGEWWQKENRGFAIGVHHTGFPLGQFIGPILIAAILMFGDWRHAFLFIPLIGLIIVVLQLIIGTKKIINASLIGSTNTN
ncbi:MFS transporter [Type-E symbiont of Plautia stali]|uniref:MFS transporter n=1 Tax=Type-E symbiont of Plautia stali TaxID=1560357 RepID=UPI000A4382AC|nr:MFS transporter [Type-E symbiont of Plautia stali]